MGYEDVSVCFRQYPYGKIRAIAAAIMLKDLVPEPSERYRIDWDLKKGSKVCVTGPYYPNSVIRDDFIAMDF